MTEFYLKSIGGFDIKVGSSGTFYAYEKGTTKEIYSAKTLEELEEKVKRHVSNARHFKPIDVIQIDADRVGRITSKVADREDFVYFTHKEKPEERATRSESRLISYSFGRHEDNQPVFAKATPENLEILKQIRDLDEQQKILRDRQDALRKLYQNKVTWEDIEFKKPRGKKK